MMQDDKNSSGDTALQQSERELSREAQSLRSRLGVALREHDDMRAQLSALEASGSNTAAIKAAKKRLLSAKDRVALLEDELETERVSPDATGRDAGLGRSTSDVHTPLSIRRFEDGVRRTLGRTKREWSENIASSDEVVSTFDAVAESEFERMKVEGRWEAGQDKYRPSFSDARWKLRSRLEGILTVSPAQTFLQVFLEICYAIEDAGIYGMDLVSVLKGLSQEYHFRNRYRVELKDKGVDDFEQIGLSLSKEMTENVSAAAKEAGMDPQTWMLAAFDRALETGVGPKRSYRSHLQDDQLPDPNKPRSAEANRSSKTVTLMVSPALLESIKTAIGDSKIDRSAWLSSHFLAALTRSEETPQAVDLGVKSERLKLYLDPELVAQIDAAAEASSINRSEWIRRASAHAVASP